MATIAEPTRFPTSETAQQDLEERAGSRPAADTLAAGTASGGSMPQAGTDLMNRVVQGAHQTIDHLAGQAAPHVQRFEQKLAGADDMLHERADQLREMSDGYVRSLREGVRENPLVAVGVALMLGLLLARITR
ncbi:MAG TPA: hypothetical protein VFL86_03695 [Burkholderiaceae bacterium]|nr:hypothetical protein [Burkholderiaceae bacterium]